MGAVLIVGGGISGIQSAVDLAESGFRVYLLDKSPTIGGAMSQLDKTFPTNDCAMCIMSPKLVETGRHHNIQLITNADVERVDGKVGNFTVTISKRPRYVDEEKCTGCGICTQRCPVVVKDEYNKGLKLRKAIYVKFPQAVPPVHTIDQEHCIGCEICETQCGAEAIRYSQEKEEIVLNVGSIILSPGFTEFDLLSQRTEYGYGRFPNVISSLELERMLSATGPFRGMILRPSDGRIPKKLAFIQCVGSRDRAKGNPYCSSVCCMFAIKEAIIAQEHVPGLQSHIFFMDIRAFGKEFEEYQVRAEKEFNVKFTRNNRISRVEEMEGNNLKLTYIEEGELKEEVFDLVVLSVAMNPIEDGKAFCEKFGIEHNEFGFCNTEIFSPIQTNVSGIYVSGTFGGPTDIPDSVAQASGAAARAQRHLASVRHTLTFTREFPDEKDVVGQEPRIGVFVCRCGINIGGVVDVPSVVEYANTLPNVVYAEENMYTCSQDTQQSIKEKIEEHGLNRIVVASCTPRTHAPLFQNTIREGGLNPYLFDMANIRDQCSWVHSSEPVKATEKTKDLVRMAAARVELLEPLQTVTTDITQSALVIGGGVTGMNAALGLADQGFDVYLVEKEGNLGGNLRHVHFGLGGEDLQAYLNELIAKLKSNEKIEVFMSSTVKNLAGHLGNFTSTIDTNGEKKELKHGVIIVAVGGKELKPTEYMYGKNEKVLTELELNDLLASGDFKAKSVVFIQCVGSRDDERPYCSRICCTNAIKNAIRMKDMNPKISVYVLFRDMRTYGFREIYYEEAARKGVVFIRYDMETKPIVTEDENGNLNVKVLDHFIEEEVTLMPDNLILSAASVPNPDNQKLAQVLKVPLNKDGFFLEAHMKLRPVDFTNEGMFVCGLAHSPKFLNECVSQAEAAVSRATISLAQGIVNLEAIISQVDEEKCCGCGTCEEICPFQAIQRVKTDRGLKAEVTAVACKGCGNCAASCPERAITMKHFTDEQLIVEGLEALGGVPDA